jgi:hypothetical protein
MADAIPEEFWRARLSTLVDRFSDLWRTIELFWQYESIRRALRADRLKGARCQRFWIVFDSHWSDLMPSSPGLITPTFSGHETVHPTPDILDALERDYPLEASIADLVDNSIDAGARHVLIRFLRTDRKLVSLCVADDGCGMRNDDMRHAMKFAAKRKYEPKDLGMFGVGLKTASLSQAEVLIVVSRASGSGAVGRQWTKTGIKQHDWRCDIIDGRSAAEILGGNWGELGTIRHGTIVRWDRVTDFDRLHSGIDEYLETATRKIQTHLGLKLHRFLERRAITIHVDVFDVKTGESGPSSKVSPMNPFPPKGSSGANGYPKLFTVKLPQAGVLKMRAYIWRKKSKEEGYKLEGGRVAEHQGFYFYRHDRLIQDGGWCGYIGTNEPHLSLARISIDIPDASRAYIKVRSNKAGVDVPATFARALNASHASDGTTFTKYLNAAEETYRRRGEQKARPMLAPGSGIPAVVKEALKDNAMRFVKGPKCSIVWNHVQGREFIHVDQEERQIVLNSRFRPILLRGAHGGKTDVPLLRTLLYFVFESLLAGERIGAVERMRLKAIQASMNAALRLEEEWASD